MQYRRVKKEKKVIKAFTCRVVLMIKVLKAGDVICRNGVRPEFSPAVSDCWVVAVAKTSELLTIIMTS